jgi:hypothetical protein
MSKTKSALSIYGLDEPIKSMDCNLESNSGFTQDGWGVFSRIFPPNFCNEAKTTVPPIRVIKAWAVKHHVHPDVLCQDAMKNCNS